MQPTARHATFMHNTVTLVTGLNASQTFYQLSAISLLTYQLGHQARLMIDQLKYIFMLNPVSENCYRGTKSQQLTQCLLS